MRVNGFPSIWLWIPKHAFKKHQTSIIRGQTFRRENLERSLCSPRVLFSCILHYVGIPTINIFCSHLKKITPLLSDMRIQLPPSHAGVVSTHENWPASASIESSVRCTFLCMSRSRTRGPPNQFVDHIGLQLK